LTGLVAGSSGAREALGAAVDALRAAGAEDPRLDAELLLSDAMGWERAALVARPEAEVPPEAGRRFGEMVRRRLRREPVAYILGRKAFRRIELVVDHRVLIPRPETELLVELALELAPRTVLDVGTGSGAIALALADELPGCAVTGTETSAGALEVARANAERLGLADRVELLPGTLPENREFDLVLANLPYVAERDWPSLQPEVAKWEPREALLAGPDGLAAYRSFFASPRLAGSLGHSTESGNSAGGLPAVAVEVGAGQAAAVAELVGAAGFGEVEVRRDLAGIERVVVGRAGRARRPVSDGAPG
jgi:release factor glutamine methyltransferase